MKEKEIMKKRLRKTLVAFGMLFTFAVSLLGNTIEVKADEVPTGMKIAKAIYDGTWLKVTLKGALEDGTNAFTVMSSDGEEAVIKEVSGKGAVFNISMEEPLDLSKKYSVVFGGNSYAITMPDYYGTEEFENAYTYTGNDLGATWTKEETTFRVWAPTADAVAVNLYKSGDASADDLLESIPMTPDANGTWVVNKNGDLNGVYYTYYVVLDEKNGVVSEACDPYARATGVNGKRAMVIDLASTNPEGWEEDVNPNAALTFNDAIIYELHIRDLGTHSSSGITNAGKYLSLTEHGTKTPGGVATGVDHMKELGITQIGRAHV